ncbi:MAG: 4-(cytidine 5'-diphospho)-2-C-methyl-D-erythritol kinase [Alphaproteobacteria bacterium]
MPYHTPNPPSPIAPILAPALTATAPAKINLTLQVTGKRADGYHLLHSLTAFTDFGDDLSLAPLDGGSGLELRVAGAFAGALTDNSSGENIVERAIRRLAAYCNKAPDFDVRLEKNLPVSAGIGGGSSDAAAAMRLLTALWDNDCVGGSNCDTNSAEFQDLLLQLGADVPVCFPATPAVFSGIGERVSPLKAFPATPIVIVNPLKPCPTAKVFQHFAQMKTAFTKPKNIPTEFQTTQNLFAFLRETFPQRQGNDLTAAAIACVPEIEDILAAFQTLPDCAYHGLSGSGASCFGLFETPRQAENAAAQLTEKFGTYWIKSGLLNAAP